MTNAEAQGYAIIAFKELLDEGIPKDRGEAIQTMYYKMSAMFDRYTEEEAEGKGDRIYLNR